MTKCGTSNIWCVRRRLLFTQNLEKLTNYGLKFTLKIQDYKIAVTQLEGNTKGKVYLTYTGDVLLRCIIIAARRLVLIALCAHDTGIPSSLYHLFPDACFVRSILVSFRTNNRLVEHAADTAHCLDAQWTGVFVWNQILQRRRAAEKPGSNAPPPVLWLMFHSLTSIAWFDQTHMNWHSNSYSHKTNCLLAAKYYFKVTTFSFGLY